MAAEILAPLSMDLGALRTAMKDSSPQASEGHASEESRYRAESSRYFGKYRGTVLSNMDPLQLGRVQGMVPAVTRNELNWATPCIPYPAGLIPTLMVPPVGASIWIEFEGGDPDYPIWSGCFWEEGQNPLLKLP